jgi:fructose-bisphosphate aldolase class II
LEEIERVAPALPLVLHGASGLADAALQAAAATNVCKINVDTELRLAFEAAVKAYYSESHAKVDVREILGPAREAMQVVVEDKLRVFGCAGRARV